MGRVRQFVVADAVDSVRMNGCRQKIAADPSAVECEGIAAGIAAGIESNLGNGCFDSDLYLFRTARLTVPPY